MRRAGAAAGRRRSLQRRLRAFGANRGVDELIEVRLELVRAHPGAEGLLRRALNQAARELLLVQASDWAFIMKTGTSVEYAKLRTADHTNRFNALYEAITKGAINEAWLADIEFRDNIFPCLDYGIYAASAHESAA